MNTKMVCFCMHEGMHHICLPIFVSPQTTEEGLVIVMVKDKANNNIHINKILGQCELSYKQFIMPELQ